MASSRLPYLFYLVLGESIFSAFACIISVIMYCRILYIMFFYLRKKKVELSPILIFHVILWLFLSLAWLIQNAYAIVFWQPTKIQYDPQILWYTGMACLPLVPIPGVALLFSTLERCAVFIFPNYNTLKRIQMILLIATITVSATVWIIMIFGFLISAPPFFDEVTTTLLGCLSPNCLSIGNVVDTRLNAITIVISCVSLIATGLLFYFIRTLHFKSQAHRDATLLTLRIVIIQIFLDFAINALAILTPAMMNQSPSNVFGSYIRVISSLNGCICAVIFAKTVDRFKKQAASSVRIAQTQSLPKTKTIVC